VAGSGQRGEDVLVGMELQALDELGLQRSFLAGAGLDGLQQGQHTDGPPGRLDRAGPGRRGGLDAAEQDLDGVRPG
jgi:hypothetical protein